MPLHYSYDPTSLAGEVRLAIGDAKTVPATAVDLTATRADWPCIFADEEIAQALSRRDHDWREAAADLLVKVASSRALIHAALRVGDYSRDPKDLPAQLRAQAAALRAEARETPAEAIVAELSNVFQAREQFVRGALDEIPGWGLP